MAGPVLWLRRTARLPAGTFGRLTDSGLSLATCEDDWRENKPSVSCIPAGRYPLRRTVYHRHGIETFEVCDVPGRSRILVHPGNTEEDTAGCILVGLRLGKLWIARDEDTGRGGWKEAVVESRAAFARFMAALDGLDELELVIEWAADIIPHSERGRAPAAAQP